VGINPDFEAQGPRIGIETNLKSPVYCGGGEEKLPGVYFWKLGFLKRDWHGLFHRKHFGRDADKATREHSGWMFLSVVADFPSDADYTLIGKYNRPPEPGEIAPRAFPVVSKEPFFKVVLICEY
jgi:hypothetical protein